MLQANAKLTLLSLKYFSILFSNFAPNVLIFDLRLTNKLIVELIIQPGHQWRRHVVLVSTQKHLTVRGEKVLTDSHCCWSHRFTLKEAETKGKHKFTNVIKQTDSRVEGPLKVVRSQTFLLSLLRTQRCSLQLRPRLFNPSAEPTAVYWSKPK